MGLTFVDKPGPGKPPKSTQFKPGQSGNPKGRPKGSRNFSSVLQKELRKKVTITEKGKSKTVTMQEVIARQLVTNSAKGNAQSIDLIFRMMRVFGEAGQGTGQGDPVALPDKDALKRIQKRIVRLIAAEDTNGPSPTKG